MKALILLGCPESPSQTPMANYVSWKLSNLGWDVSVASTPAASKLLEVGDPNNQYIKNKIDIDSTLNTLEEGQFDLLIGFVSKDAAASYFVTFYHILKIKALALIFEKDLDVLEDLTNIVRESTDAEMVSVKAYHNPTPLKVKFNKSLDKLLGNVRD
ncbi:DUF1890 domain-containing protein [Methanobrevibacter filiformis]|uniref:DUF1890 domain-containing protein n=1 Tax=Methanobrevibacter filiformis TaxID=55758 RepID=A0A165Z1I2_9EURY|nr:DUF1890 domain-containing protein [Methanobrevibacter filiformis]KZX10129.1 hypothetical protein MBFIL_18780 [Methanobrevibacter filiformis]